MCARSGRGVEEEEGGGIKMRRIIMRQRPVHWVHVIPDRSETPS